MAKRSKRRTSRHERNQAGCITGIINVFHFRHGRSTKRLPADRKQAVGAGNSTSNTISSGPTEKCESLADIEERKMLMADLAKTSVKKLMEEEMHNEKGSKQPNDSEVGPEQKSGNHTKKHQKKKRSSAKSSDMDFDRVRVHKSLDNNLDLEKVLEELANIKQRNTKYPEHDFDGDIDEEKLAQAVKIVIEQKLSNSKPFCEERNNCCSQELMDALNTLSLNEGLFLKLLQEPNSELLKHIQNFEDARLICKDQKFSCSPASQEKPKPVNLKPDELISHKSRNFFRRRSKSLESYPLIQNNKDCQSPNNIVILKPGPVGFRSPETDTADNNNNKVHNERSTSQFSFTEIKRKLRHAIGKESRGDSPTKFSPNHSNGSNGDKLGENFRWSSPNRNHFYTEKFTLSSPSFRKGEPLKDEGPENIRVGGSNIYIEAKKHLCAMVENGDGNTESTSGNNRVKSLGRILSLPEYNNSSPCLSPRKHVDDFFITAQMRLSPHGTKKDNLSPRMLNSESQPSDCNSEGKIRSSNANINDSLGDDQEYSLDIQCFNEDTVVSDVQAIVVEVEQTTELRLRAEENIMSISCEPSSDSIGGDFQNGDIREIDIEESASPCFKSHLSGEDQEMSPSHGRESTEIEDSDRAVDKIERPSPVSVLEPLFADEDISPASTTSHPVEKDIQPRHIHFEEEEPSAYDEVICTRISLEDEESAFEYVEAVLLGSGLNWDEFLLRWVSFYEILDSSLFDEVELFSSRPRHDQKLLFDCANEALKEVCEFYFGCFANVKPNTRPVPKGMDLIYEVWGRVERLIFQNSQSHSLDGLVKKDLAGYKNWMNIRPDIEFIVFDMQEMIFDELVDEIIPSSEADNSECEFTEL